METKTHIYLREHQLMENSILDLIRMDFGKDDIINTISTLYKSGDVVLSFGGSYPFNACTISVHPSKWDIYTKRCDGVLRSMYRNGIKKKEILIMREIMWAITEKIFHHKLDDIDEFGSYTHPASWTYVRTTHKFGEMEN